ncbi:hypothetical protein EMCRGX_G017377 [Ephydatia muelleri]|eukprot:Em0008g90a
MERPSLPVREVSPYQRVESMVHFRTSINLGFDVEVAGCMSKIGSDGEKSCDACIDIWVRRKSLRVLLIVRLMYPHPMDASMTVVSIFERLFYSRGGLVLAMGATWVVVAAARGAAGEVVVGALVSVPVVGLVLVAAVLLLLLLEVGAALLLLLLMAAGAALLLLLLAVGAVLLLQLAADGKGAALHLAAVAGAVAA